MYGGKLILVHAMEHLPLQTFRRTIAHYLCGQRMVKSFSCLYKFLCMAFTQVIFLESLREGSLQ
jgi:hypothetical protein